MSENKVIWHPYPQEKPKKNDSYLITLKGRNSIPFVCQDIYNDDIKAFRFEGYSTFEKVTAWAELPEPYKENKNI